MRVTLKDIAAEVGVSPSLVSLYLNHHPLAARIAKSTKEKIDAAVTKLGYRPNMNARALLTGKSATIGLVIGGMTQRIRGCFVHALMNEAKKRGYHLLIANTNYNQQEERAELEYMLSRQVDGILYHLSLDPESRICRELKEKHFPILLHGTQKKSGLNGINISMDPLPQAVAALQSRGHRRIGVLCLNCGDPDFSRILAEENARGMECAPLCSTDEVLQQIRERRLTALVFAHVQDREKLLQNPELDKLELVVSCALPFQYVQHPGIIGALTYDFRRRAAMEVERIIAIIEHPEAEPETVFCPARYLDKMEYEELYRSQRNDPDYQEFL